MERKWMKLPRRKKKTKKRKERKKRESVKAPGKGHGKNLVMTLTLDYNA